MSIASAFFAKNPAHVSHKLKGDKRLPGESYDAYCKRRKEEQRLLDNYLQGDMVWCSKAFKQKEIGHQVDGTPITMLVLDRQKSKGTLVKARDGVPKSRRRAEFNRDWV